MKLFTFFFAFYYLTNILFAKESLFTQKEKEFIEVSTIKVAMVPNIHPFNMYENGKLNGFSYDILQLISKKSGLNFNFEVDNWSYNLNKFETLPYEKIENSNSDSIQTDYKIPLAIFSSKNLKKYSDIQNPINSKMKINKNIFYKNDIFESDFIEIFEKYGLKQKLRTLSFSSDVDLIIGPLLGIQANIIKDSNTNIKVLSELKLPTIKKEDLQFGINKNNLLLQSIIQKSFDNISTLEWDNLNKKWTDVYLSKNVLTLNKTINITNEEKEYLKEKETIKICTSLGLAPIEFLDKDNNLKGMSIDILSIINKKMNIIFKYIKTTSIEQSLSFLQEKKCDIISNVENNKIQSKDILFTQDYLNYKLAIITQKNNPLISSLETAMEQTLILKKNSIFIKKLKSQFPHIKVIETANHYKSMESVNNHSSYFTLLPLPIASYYISEYAMSNLYISLYTNIEYSIKMAVRQEDRILLNLLNKSLEQITTNQSKTITNKWTTLPIKVPFDYSFMWKTMGVGIFILLILLYRQSILNKYNNHLKSANEIIEKKSIELELLTNNLEERVKKEVKQNEAKTNQLIQQSRLAQMGELISMIAHQWKQPLTSVSTTANYILAQSLLDKPLPKKELEEEVSLIIDYTQHLSTTIADFKNFYKIDKIKKEITIEEIADKSLNIIQSSLDTNCIQINKDYHGLKKIYTYETEVNQVILNLLKNAEDALVENKIKNPEITLATYIKESRTVLEVSDNAGGIKDEYLEQLFDPYFSTKKSKDGSGLGLYMGKTIIEEHCKGMLEVKNNKFGATFTISI